jgi:two-component system CheB/CheR fusion protein
VVLQRITPSRTWHILAGVLMVLIFATDLITPAGISVPTFYVIPVILFVSGSRFAEPLVLAAIATLLTLIGYYLSPAGADPETAAGNRVISVAAVWATAGFVIGYGRIVQDWTSRLQSSNEALETSVRRLKDLERALDQSAIVAATDQAGKITYVNDKFCEISRYGREELLGQDHRIINSGFHSKEFIRDLWQTIANGRVWRGELRNRAKDGSIYWVDTTIVPFLNERGKPWQYLSIRSDITQRKAAEERLRDEAALTQLGRMSAVVAHEVRNPLAAVKGGLQVLASRLPADLPGREIITPMMGRIDALNRTVQDILTYSKPQPAKGQRFNIAQLIGDIAATARSAVPAATIRVDETPVIVHADPEMTRAVLLNLLLNAAQASGERPIDVTLSQSGGYCEIRVLDRGPGLPPEVREHLFEPFISTRQGGTGLGLAIARRLTQQQGGTIALEEREGGGTAAIVRLRAENSAPDSNSSSRGAQRSVTT